jgi:hypothetical protein
VLRESKFKEHGRITPGTPFRSRRTGLGANGRGVCGRWRLLDLQISRMAMVCPPQSEFIACESFVPAGRYGAAVASPEGGAVKLIFREKGDSSKARDFLPADKQYLITRNG